MHNENFAEGDLSWIAIIIIYYYIFMYIYIYTKGFKDLFIYKKIFISIACYQWLV